MDNGLNFQRLQHPHGCPGIPQVAMRVANHANSHAASKRRAPGDSGLDVAKSKRSCQRAVAKNKHERPWSIEWIVTQTAAQSDFMAKSSASDICRHPACLSSQSRREDA